MILHAHSDASCLSAPKSRSKLGGHFYLSSRPKHPHRQPDSRDPMPPMNGAILVNANVIKHVSGGKTARMHQQHLRRENGTSVAGSQQECAIMTGVGATMGRRWSTPSNSMQQRLIVSKRTRWLFSGCRTSMLMAGIHSSAVGPHSAHSAHSAYSARSPARSFGSLAWLLAPGLPLRSLRMHPDAFTQI